MPESYLGQPRDALGRFSKGPQTQRKSNRRQRPTGSTMVAAAAGPIGSRKPRRRPPIV